MYNTKHILNFVFGQKGESTISFENGHALMCLLRDLM